MKRYCQPCEEETGELVPAAGLFRQTPMCQAYLQSAQAAHEHERNWARDTKVAERRGW